MVSRFLLGLGLLVPMLSVARGGDPPKEENTGLKVGTAAPAFKLKDQNGVERSLEDFVKTKKKVALVFYRSAEW